MLQVVAVFLTLIFHKVV